MRRELAALAVGLALMVPPAVAPAPSLALVVALDVPGLALIGWALRAQRRRIAVEEAQADVDLRAVLREWKL